jgi:hypothetical protein
MKRLRDPDDLMKVIVDRPFGGLEAAARQPLTPWRLIQGYFTRLFAFANAPSTWFQ